MAFVIEVSHLQFPRKTFGPWESVGQKSGANVALTAEAVIDCSAAFKRLKYSFEGVREQNGKVLCSTASQSM